jgi:hypothetical protein
MRKIVVLGASHATRIYSALLRHPKASEFKFFKNTKPGASLGASSSTQVPIDTKLYSDLRNTDIVLVQYTGNDLLEKRIQISKNPKNIHITEFIPKSDAYVNQARQKLEKILEKTSAKVIIIDDILRHVRCCKKHLFPGLIRYLSKRNRELKAHFPDYLVLDHRRLINEKFSKIRNLHSYKNLLEDSVHLKGIYYDQIADNLFQKYF